MAELKGSETYVAAAGMHVCAGYGSAAVIAEPHTAVPVRHNYALGVGAPVGRMRRFWELVTDICTARGLL